MRATGASAAQRSLSRTASRLGHGSISLSGGILRVGGWFVEDYDYTDAVLTLDAATGEVLSDSGVMESADDGYRESGKFSLEDGYLMTR